LAGFGTEMTAWKLSVP